MERQWASRVVLRRRGVPRERPPKPVAPRRAGLPVGRRPSPSPRDRRAVADHKPGRGPPAAAAPADPRPTWPTRRRRRCILWRRPGRSCENTSLRTDRCRSRPSTPWPLPRSNLCTSLLSSLWRGPRAARRSTMTVPPEQSKTSPRLAFFLVRTAVWRAQRPPTQPSAHRARPSACCRDCPTPHVAWRVQARGGVQGGGEGEGRRCRRRGDGRGWRRRRSRNLRYRVPRD
mmetsp:Transcript_12747/g.38171  ORF Transcript_12747/g.38171 Transcript_12747/m.38171 type:complete len:230 (-) Transcript_12747:1172-1861(-)